jgi:hypothetical protein
LMSLKAVRPRVILAGGHQQQTEND